jgi:hypothetical protein
MSRPRYSVAPAGNLHWDQHVLEGGQRRHQMEELKDEPDFFAAQFSPGRLRSTA